MWEIPPRFFEAIGRNALAASRLEDALTQVAVLLQAASDAPMVSRNDYQEALRKYAGQPGTVLIEAIRNIIATHSSGLDYQDLQELLEVAKAALESRHALMHTSWFLFDFAGPGGPSIGGLRYLPPRKRSQAGELTQFVEGSIERSRKNLSTLEGIVLQLLKWARKFNDTHSIWPRTSGFRER